MTYRIQLVDDEENVLKALGRVLGRRANFELETFTDPEQALKRAHTSSFNLFLSDYRMPKMDGVAFLKEVRKLQPDAMRMILSGYSDIDALIGAINEAEIYRYIAKPWQDKELVLTILKALEHHDLQIENRRLAEQLRQQERELDRRRLALETLERNHPALVHVDWTKDGAILLDEGDACPP